MKKLLVIALILFSVTVIAQQRFDVVSSKVSQNGSAFSNFSTETGVVSFSNQALYLRFRDINETFYLVRDLGTTQESKGSYTESVYHSDKTRYITFILHISSTSGNVYLYMFTDKDYIVELKLIQ